MQKFLPTATLIVLVSGTLTGCNSKGMDLPDKEKVVIYDEARDGAVKEGGGPGVKTDSSGKKMGKKLPPPAK